MPATPKQVAAAEAALKKVAEQKIETLELWEQPMARGALSEELMRSFAKAAADATEDAR